MVSFIIIIFLVSIFITIMSIKYFPFNSFTINNKKEINPNREKLKQDTMKKLKHKKRDS